MNAKKLTLFCFFIFFTYSALGHTIRCPTVDEIKNQQFDWWIPLYINNEEWASAGDVSRFKQSVTDFKEAQWSKAYQENAHCFYRGPDPILNEIVFAQDAWRPVQEGQWKWINQNKFAACYSSNPEDCWFQT